MPAWRLADRDAVRLGEGGERRLGLRIERAAAGDDRRGFFAAFSAATAAGEFVLVGARATRSPDPLLEQKPRDSRYASAWTSWHSASVTGPHSAGSVSTGHGAGEGGDDLLGPGDAVEIARDRAEAVVRRDGAVGEHLDLLQHGVGAAVGEDVARQQQKRHAVDMGDGGGGDHVGRAGADGGGAGHEAAAAHRLGIGGGGVRHGLLVMGAVGRQRIADLVERLAHAGDIAMAEDREDAARRSARFLPSITVFCAARKRTSACAMVRRIVVMACLPWSFD